MDTAVTNYQGGGAVAATGAYDPYAAYGAQAAGAKTFLKYAKGDYTAGANDEEVPLGTRLVANMAELQAGWQRWWDGKPSQEVMELVGSGKAPPKRHELGDNDQALWEKDNEGRPRDPWSFTNVLPLKNHETGDEYVFSIASRGGIGAIGQLCKEYGKVYRMKPGQLPVIELQSDSYMHPTYKKVFVPKLVLVDWADEASLISGAEPAAEAPKGGKTKF